MVEIVVIEELFSIGRFNSLVSKEAVWNGQSCCSGIITIKFAMAVGSLRLRAGVVTAAMTK